MFTKRITIIRLLGIDVKIDATWVFLALLVTWSLATELFPQNYAGHSELTYWLMAASGALGLFASIIAHEFGHAVVARRYGIPIEDITLFIFGGVANMKREPDHARDEFLMAIAGPLVSIAIAVAGYVVLLATDNRAALESFGSESAAASDSPIAPVLAYLVMINGMLAVFNMIPAFPLDGGRVFRAFLWGVRGDLRSATKTASAVGSGFGIFLMILGVWSFFSGSLVTGVWWFILGTFVRNASRSSYQHVLLKSSLGGRTVSNFMSRELISVPPQSNLREFVEHYVYRFHHKLYPVIDGSRVYGVVTTQDLSGIDPEQWTALRVADVMKPVDAANSVDAATDAMVALGRMNESGRARLLVTDRGRIAGVIALKDLLEYLNLRLSLEPDR